MNDDKVFEENIHKISGKRIAKKIRKLVLGLHNFMDRLSVVKFILLATLLNIGIIIIISPLHIIYPIVEDYVQPTIFWGNVFGVVVVAPIWETFAFQTIPLFILGGIRSDEERIRFSSIIVSAFLFGGIHYLDYYYSFIKFISTFLMGVVLAYAYELYYYKGRKPYLITALIHSLTNLVFLLPTLLM